VQTDGGGFFVSTHVQHASLLSGRQFALAVTIALHGVILGALMAIGVVTPVVEAVQKRIQATIFEEKPDKPRPITNADALQNLIRPHTDPELPVIDEYRDPPMDERKSDDVMTTSGVEAYQQGGTGALIAPTDLQAVATRSADDYYPSASIRLEEEGVAIVRVCVDASGQPAGRPTVDASSGFARLDAAAVQWAREALRFTPATRDGVAVPGCKGFRVRFDLK
jgi:protein TonB